MNKSKNKLRKNSKIRLSYTSAFTETVKRYNAYYGATQHPHSVAYLGFPATGGILSFGAPTQPVHGSIHEKNELGIKGRRKLTRARQSPAYSCF